MNCKAIAFAAALFAAASGVHAAEVYGTVGTEGLGVGFGYGVTEHLGARVDVNGFGISHSFTAGDIRYDGKLRMVHGGLYADFFPAPSVLPFRLTAGVLVGQDKIDVTGSAMNNTYTINGTTYSANGQTITGRVKMPTVRPYIGIGFGHTPKAAPGWSMSFDAGVAYGKPSVDLNVPASIVAEAGQANVDAERQELQDKANKLKFYPIVKLGVTYRW